MNKLFAAPTLEMLHCKVCHNSRFHTVYTLAGIAVQACRQCGLGVTTPSSVITQSQYDSDPVFAGRYATDEAKYRVYCAHILESLAPLVKSGRLLDIGCSVGILVDEANRRDFQAEGIDLDTHAIALGRAQGRPVHEIALDDWSARDYDVVCLQHTLEHISQPEEFLRRCGEVLRPGGILAIVVPCYAGLHPRIFGRRWYGWLPTQHYYHYTPRALRAVLQAAGLEPLRIWQEPMDHRPTMQNFRRWQDGAKAILGYATAQIGGMIGMGDQLVAISRRLPVSSEGSQPCE